MSLAAYRRAQTHPTCAECTGRVRALLQRVGR
jgi:hypothetical protein